MPLPTTRIGRAQARRLREVPFVESEGCLILARDPAVVGLARAAAAGFAGARPAVVVGHGGQALARLVAPGRPPRHLICDPAAAGRAWPGLLAVMTDPFSPTDALLVGAGPQGLGPGLTAGPLAEALAAPRRRPPRRAGDDPAALRGGLERGEILVRFQPVVRVRDRRPVLVEVLARWRQGGEAVRPDEFVALAERSGLGRRLGGAVARRAGQDLAGLVARLRLGLSINLPLHEILRPDTVSWLRRVLAGARLPAGSVAVELTETTPVRDRSTLRRALLRLRRAGYRVLLDDLTLDDGRAALLALPFSGVKLDRALVAALLVDARTRVRVRRLLAGTRRAGLPVVAEGVETARHWQACAALGIGYAQGFGVGRPLPAAALSAWCGAWRGYQPPA